MKSIVGYAVTRLMERKDNGLLMLKAERCTVDGYSLAFKKWKCIKGSKVCINIKAREDSLVWRWSTIYILEKKRTRPATLCHVMDSSFFFLLMSRLDGLFVISVQFLVKSVKIKSLTRKLDKKTMKPKIGTSTSQSLTIYWITDGIALMDGRLHEFISLGRSCHFISYKLAKWKRRDRRWEPI